MTTDNVRLSRIFRRSCDLWSHDTNLLDSEALTIQPPPPDESPHRLGQNRSSAAKLGRGEIPGAPNKKAPSLDRGIQTKNLKKNLMKCDPEHDHLVGNGKAIRHDKTGDATYKPTENVIILNYPRMIHEPTKGYGCDAWSAP